MNSKWLVGKPTNFIDQLTIKWNWLDSLNQQTWMLPNVDTLWPVDPGVNIQKIRCCGACTSGALNVRSRERWSIESSDVAVAIYVKHAFWYVVVTSTSPANWGCHKHFPIVQLFSVGEIRILLVEKDSFMSCSSTNKQFKRKRAWLLWNPSKEVFAFEKRIPAHTRADSSTCV